MLRGGRKPTPLELALDLEVSTRTVARDIKFMRILGAPVVHDRKAGGYVREKIWHPTQKMTELDDGGVELALEVESLLEVKRWILSWGANAEVLKPKSLRKQMAEEGEGILKAHSKHLERKTKINRE